VIGSSRGLRGGSWFSPGGSSLRSAGRGDDDPAVEDFVVGFRVASVPEPSTAVLVLMGVGALYLWKRRRATL
jgi:formylglycine-generating enzyme